MNARNTQKSGHFDALQKNDIRIFTPRISHTTKSAGNTHGTPTSAKERFIEKHPEINIHYFTDFTREILTHFYPQTCSTYGSTEFKIISTR